MNLTTYRDYFESLARKPLFGHNPEQGINRFLFLRSSIKELTALSRDPEALTLMAYEPRLQRLSEGGMFRDTYQCDFELFRPCNLEDEAQELAIKTEAEIKAGKLFLKVVHDFYENYQSGLPGWKPDPNSFTGQYFAGVGENECGFSFQFTIKADVGYNQPDYLVIASDWE